MSSEDEKINALLTEVRVLEGTFNELSARQNILERALLESRAAIETISNLESSKTEEVLIPVGGGVLIRSSPPNAEKILINVGANVVIEKGRETAIEVMGTGFRADHRRDTESEESDSPETRVRPSGTAGFRSETTTITA
ncbi:MAG: prefoldin subunit alpha [Thaumarchaeota archaeon]|nr:prefoldin subunit alpha [Nitrososphaerota archaeon]